MSIMDSWPDEYELLEFFGVEPYSSKPKDGFWCYEKDYEGGLSLRFSFDIYMGSVQTDITLNSTCISSVCHEGAKTLSLSSESGKKILRCVFKDQGYKRILNLDIEPSCVVTWSTIKL
ncbi:MAG: hypothetical protein OXT67_04635 [Zetaproteobacteria bacterium]|nr:hypothetical protein [Zetaproteobacteria bacterium]